MQIELTKNVSETVSIPVIASGGCGNKDHALKVLNEGKADAIAVASIFHYEKLQKLIHYFSGKNYVEGNLNYIQDFIEGKSIGRKNIEPTSILELKMFLNENNFFIRV